MKQKILEIINKSELLKDVKQGLAILTDASGPIRLFVNIKSLIFFIRFLLLDKWLDIRYNISGIEHLVRYHYTA